MTSPEGRLDRPQPVRLNLSRRDAGTMLGALAWVMGALEIMRDRATNNDDTAALQMFQQVSPKIDRLVEQLGAARNASMTRPEFEAEIEDAFAEVRGAFETWIEMTALDTLTAVVSKRIETEGLDPSLIEDDEPQP
ncbi:MAG: hypothetical protein EPO65_08790 [Dehalococcoidia bacterium]|nr:MAG: hypothetical protein EPO65_08790 [Dehalococcoidia bacterium]